MGLIPKYKPSIFIAIPNMGMIHTQLSLRLLDWVTCGKYQIKYYPPENVCPLHRARNLCHKMFLESGMDYLFFLDADTVPPVDVLDRFLAHDVDAVSAVVQTWKDGGPIPVAFDWSKEKNGYVPHYGQGLEEVDVSTLACTLIKRKAMMALPKGVFEFIEDDEWKTSGYSEDFVFCRAAKEQGIKIHVDYGVLCSHMKEIDLREVNALLVGEKNAR